MSQTVDLTNLCLLCNKAQNYQELSFIMVNDLKKVLPGFEYAVSIKGRNITAISGVNRVEHSSAYAYVALVKELPDPQAIAYIASDKDKKIPRCLWLPLNYTRGTDYGVLLVNIEDDREYVEDLLKTLQQLFTDTMQTIFFKQFYSPLLATIASKKLYAGMIVLFAIMFIPVLDSSIAPAVLVSANNTAITAPVSGVIKKFSVTPNESVEINRELFFIDDIESMGKLNSANKEQQAAQIRYQQMQNKSMSDEKAKEAVVDEWANLAQKEVEVNFLKNQLNLHSVKTLQSGVAIFHDVDDWLGKSVNVGETIMLIADTNRLEINIELPITEHINFKEPNEILVYFNSDPWKGYPGKVKYVSYQAAPNSNNILCYKVVAELKELPKGELNIGMHGLAKVYDKKVFLWQYLLRKPLIYLRSKIGI